MKIELTTIGKLKEAIKNMDDARSIICQVCDNNHKAWNMYGIISDDFDKSKLAVISFTHPNLEQLIDAGWKE